MDQAQSKCAINWKTWSGKTAMIKDAFSRNGVRWKYFSASTMDPWTDFVGIPKESKKIIDEKEVSFIQMVRPLDFALGEVEAIFLDEFNRSAKKIRNSVMELIQFKSINGEKLKNLRMIWAAINPDDDGEMYDVERLDPAQLDRFEVHKKIEYRPDADYFRSKFGKELADAAISWWNELDDETKNIVSPRRLDYSIMAYQRNGDLRDYLPQECGVSKLLHTMREGPTGEKIAGLMKMGDKQASSAWMANENNFSSAIKYIIESKPLLEWFLPLLKQEKLASLMSSSDKVLKSVMSNVVTIDVYAQIVFEILSADSDQKLTTKIKRHFTQNSEVGIEFSEQCKKRGFYKLNV